MNILFLGDSITDSDHCFSPDNLGFGYVKFLSDLYSQANTQPLLINGGTDGFTFPRILQKWTHMYSSSHWDIVCILAGVNEVGYLESSRMTEKNRNSYLDQSELAFRQLLLSLHEHQATHIFVLEPFLFESPSYLLTWKPSLEQITQRIRTVVSEQTSVCRSASVPITCCNLQSYFDQLVSEYGIPPLSSDGIHLTEKGHHHLAEYIYAKLTSLDSFHH